MFDLMLHVLSQFNYRLVVPVDDAIDVHSLDTYVGAPVRSSSDSSRPQRNWLRAGGTDYYFLVFYEALVLWGYTATAATQDQTEGKIIFIKFVDRHPLHSVLSFRHRPTLTTATVWPSLAVTQPHGQLAASAAAISATHSLVTTLAHTCTWLVLTLAPQHNSIAATMAYQHNMSGAIHHGARHNMAGATGVEVPQIFHTKFKAVVNSTNRKGRLGKRPVFQVPWSYISIEGDPIFSLISPRNL